MCKTYKQVCVCVCIYIRFKLYMSLLLRSGIHIWVLQLYSYIVYDTCIEREIRTKQMIILHAIYKNNYKTNKHIRARVLCAYT